MNEDRASKTVDSLIKRTKTGDLKWERIKTDRLRDRFVADVVDVSVIDPVDSFFCAFKSGFIYIFSEEYYTILSSIYIQPRKGAALTELSVPKKSLSQLKNIIRDSIDNIDDFLDELNGG